MCPNSTPYFPDNTTDYAPWVAKHGLLQPYGKCQCGCGEDAPIAKQANQPYGYACRQPTRFVKWHCIPTTLENRFWEHVTQGPFSECWKWQGCVGKDGYGKFRLNGKHVRTHRASWEVHFGAIPNGLHVCHDCDVNYPPGDISYRQCVNPYHLWLGTHADNMHDRDNKGRHIPPMTHGEQNGRSKLTEANVIEIRKQLAQGVSQSALGRQYGVAGHSIYMIAHGKLWRHVP